MPKVIFMPSGQSFEVPAGTTILVSAIQNGVRLRHEVGVDRMMWSTDFPHVVSRWPKSLQALESQMVGVPEQERWSMVAGNAIKFFHLDHKADGKESKA